MLEPSNNNELPAIPAKRYFAIGEVSELCGVKPLGFFLGGYFYLLIQIFQTQRF
jgi:hypothetical protein